MRKQSLYLVQALLGIISGLEGSSIMFLSVSTPSSSGMRISRMTRLIGVVFSFYRASMPLFAVTTEYPSRRNSFS